MDVDVILVIAIILVSLVLPFVFVYTSASVYDARNTVLKRSTNRPADPAETAVRFVNRIDQLSWKVNRSDVYIEWLDENEARHGFTLKDVASTTVTGREKGLRSSIERIRKRFVRDTTYNRHYDNPTSLSCKDLTDGYWPAVENDGHVTTDIVHAYERSGLPLYSSRPVDRYVLCANGETIQESACDPGSVYAGGGRCRSVTDTQLRCLRFWPGHRIPMPDNRSSYAECTPFDPSSSLNYVTLECDKDDHVFDYESQECVVKSDPDAETVALGLCLKHEIPIRIPTRDGSGRTKLIYADPICAGYVGWEEIDYDCENELDHFNLRRFPGGLLKCNPSTYRVDRYYLNRPWFRRVAEVMSSVFPGLYATYYLPFLYYSKERDVTGNERVVTKHPETWRDMPSGSYSKNKLRLSHSLFEPTMSFCALSLHTHTYDSAIDGDRGHTVCTVPECCVPEVLDDIEMETIRNSPKPYYACSWIEKHKLFVWNDETRSFDLLKVFDHAIAIYSDVTYKRDRGVVDAAFGFRSYSSPVSNTEFDASTLGWFADRTGPDPHEILGYVWKLDSDDTDKDKEGVESGDDCRREERVEIKRTYTDRVCRTVMNFLAFPRGFYLEDDGSVFPVALSP